MRKPLRLLAATLVTGLTMLALDLAWIGKVGRSFYAMLGTLQRAEPARHPPRCGGNPTLPSNVDGPPR